MIDLGTWWHNLRLPAIGGPPQPLAQAQAEAPHERLAERLEIWRETAEGLVREVIDRARHAVAGPPKGPFPTMADLAAKFPRAGLPAKIMGTTVDVDAMTRPGTSADQLMAKVASMGMNTVRLGAYWDRIYPNGPDQPDWKELDALLDAARRHGVKVILAVGAKSPNWPEFHVPKWALPPHGTKEPSRDPAFRRHAEAFVRDVARHTAGHDAICMWQVENEPFDKSGPERMFLGADFVTREAALLRAADGGRRPIMVNGWSAGDRRDEIDQAFAVADLVGLDVYSRIPSALNGFERTVAVPAYALEQAKKSGKPAMIAELQADDWAGYHATGSDVKKLTHDLQALGYQDFLFWRLRQNLENEAKGDDSLTRAITELVRE